MESNQSFHFENLDSIRTIAFFSTFLAHAFYTESTTVASSDLFRFANSFRELFSFGVPIFFVLSGFLISYLMLREQELHSKFNLGMFYMRRVLRIWPVYFLVLIVGFVLFPIIRTSILHQPFLETADWRLYVTFLSNFDQIWSGSLPYGVGLGPTWSVSIEEQFYLFWPLLILVFPKRKFNIPVLVTIITAIGLTLLYKLSNKHTIYCMTYLAVGGGFAYLAYYYEQSVRKVVQFTKWIFPLLIVLLLSMIYLSVLGYGSILLVFGIAFVIGLSIVFQCYAGTFQLQRIPLLERWGKYTYGLYLYHVICNFVIYTAFSIVIGENDNVFFAVFFRPLCSLLMSMLVSYLSYHYMERYFLQLKARFTPKKG